MEKLASLDQLTAKSLYHSESAELAVHQLTTIPHQILALIALKSLLTARLALPLLAQLVQLASISQPLQTVQLAP